VLDRIVLQLAKQPGRRSCARLRVHVRRHLSGEHTVWRGPQCLGRYDAQGRPLTGTLPRSSKTLRARLPRRPAVRPKNARAHLAPDRECEARSSLDPPSNGAPARIRRGPRLPVGPGL
jgi:hypothetical protein